MLAALAGIAVGHLVASFVNPAASPVLAVGSTVIDATPTPVKEFAVARFGTNDKPILLASVTLGTLAAAAVAGVLTRRRPALGIGFLLVLTGLATAAAITRPVAAPVDALPGVSAAVTGMAVLLGLRRLYLRSDASPPRRADDGMPATAIPTSSGGRRQFLVGAVGVSGVAVGAAALGQRLAGSDAGAGAGAKALPKPSSPARPLATGVEGKVRGISPLRTSTTAFYRVDTNLTVPRVDASRWQLTVDGMVDRTVCMGYDELLTMPMIERDIAMTCVSNEVGGQYVGAARWLGVRLTDILDRAGVRQGADQLLSTAVDGFTIGTPMEVARDGRDAMVAVGMNGQPLPAAHGFPARLITPGLYGFVGATKWLVGLRATTYAKDRAYWTRRDWATDAPIRTSSRVDTPRPLSTIKAGTTAIGGVAWAQHRGIAKVEVSVDGGAWTEATMGPNVGVDYWRQWYLPWTATKGQHTISARATDGKGQPQSAARKTPFPSGSSGLQQLIVFVS